MIGHRRAVLRVGRGHDPPRKWPFASVFDGDPELIERFEQLRRVAVDAERAGRAQLVLAIAAAQQADAEHPGTPRCQEVPDGVADDIALVGRNTEPLLAGEEQVRLGLGAQDVAALDDDRSSGDAERAQRLVDLRPAAGRRDAVEDFVGPERSSSSTAPGSGRRSGRNSRNISPWRRWSRSSRRR